MIFGSVHILLFIAWHFETTCISQEKDKHFGTFLCPCGPYGSRVSFIGEERRKKMPIFNFFKIRLLSFYKAELKSEDIFVLGAFSRYLFCWL